jgi:hypothetical protein
MVTPSTGHPPVTTDRTMMQQTCHLVAALSLRELLNRLDEIVAGQ